MLEMGKTTATIPLERIESNPFQSRTIFKEFNIKELADSIQSVGLLNRILLRPHPHKDGCFQLVHGERRLKAYELLGWDAIPADIKDLSDKDMIEINLIENLQRENLNPIEEAMGYKRLMIELDYKQQQIAERIGKSQPYVANSLRLLKLSDDLQFHILHDILTPWHARIIASIKDSVLIRHLTDLAVEWDMSVKEVRDAVKHIQKDGTFEILRNIWVKCIDNDTYKLIWDGIPFLEYTYFEPTQGMIKFFETGGDWNASTPEEGEKIRELKLEQPICVVWQGILLDNAEIVDRKNGCSLKLTPKLKLSPFDERHKPFICMVGPLKVKIWRKLKRKSIKAWVSFIHLKERATEVFNFYKEYKEDNGDEYESYA